MNSLGISSPNNDIEMLNIVACNLHIQDSQNCYRHIYLELMILLPWHFLVDFLIEPSLVAARDYILCRRLR